MIIMALDHTRDLLHIGSMTGNPTDLATTTPILFFTRWITHLCAPSFVFLSGTSAWLSMQNRKEGNNGRRFLLTRGIWLIVLEFTLINFALWFDIHFRMLMFQVIADRAKRAAVIVTTNLPFSEWSQAIPNHDCARRWSID